MSAGAMLHGVKSLPCMGEELSLDSQRCANSDLNPTVPLVGEKVQTGECTFWSGSFKDTESISKKVDGED